MSDVRSRLLLFFLLFLAGDLRAMAGPTVTVGKKVPELQRIPVSQLDHALWSQLLQTYVDTRGMVDYSGWQSSAQAMRLLDQYLAQLSAADLSSDSNDRASLLAFWINAYNAVTVKGILREYPTSSIRNHTARLIGYNIWKDLKLLVSDLQVSLDSMEHEHLRKMGEPRIHFAIVCASIGCPRLLNEAYEPERLDQQLSQNARAFFADPGKFQFDARRQSVGLSPILNWFGGDFGRSRTDQLRAIAPYVPESAKSALSAGQVKVRFLNYDWNLNDQKTVR